mgnify:CR=1 FL=1
MNGSGRYVSFMVEREVGSNIAAKSDRLEKEE